MSERAENMAYEEGYRSGFNDAKEAAKEAAERQRHLLTNGGARNACAAITRAIELLAPPT